MNLKTVTSRILLVILLVNISIATGSIIQQDNSLDKKNLDSTQYQDRVVEENTEIVTTLSSKCTTSITTATSLTTVITQKSKSTTIPVQKKVTKTTTQEYLVYYDVSKRVHRSSCKYADKNMRIVKDNYVEEGRRCQICNPDVEIGIVYTDPAENKTYNNTDEMTFYKNMRGTYYTSSLGTVGRYGKLSSGYSVAINGLDGGTVVYIESNCTGVGGYYQVMDTGGMGYSIVDFFYSAGSVPSEFAWRGNIELSVWIVN